jgi:hypothetical protein
VSTFQRNIYVALKLEAAAVFFFFYCKLAVPLTEVWGYGYSGVFNDQWQLPF